VRLAHRHSAILQIGVLRRLVQHNGDSTRPRGGCRHSAGACPAASSHVTRPTHSHASRPMQRLPRIIGNPSVAREWAFTSRRVSADEVHPPHRTSALSCFIPLLTGLQAGLLSRYTCIYMLSLACSLPLPAAFTTPMQTFRQPPSFHASPLP